MAQVKATVKLSGGTVKLTEGGTHLLNTEVEARQTWYSGFEGGIPRKPYTPAQRASLRALEKAKAALVAHVAAANFKDAAKLVGYTPQYSPRIRALVPA